MAWRQKIARDEPQEFAPDVEEQIEEPPQQAQSVQQRPRPVQPQVPPQQPPKDVLTTTEVLDITEGHLLRALRLIQAIK
jgi:hypothetical protein